jgi:hypothetical protein
VKVDTERIAGLRPDIPSVDSDADIERVEAGSVHGQDQVVAGLADGCGPSRWIISPASIDQRRQLLQRILKDVRPRELALPGGE